ncbi:hypothetical protein ABVT39_010951 [Epinephelus coioides]
MLPTATIPPVTRTPHPVCQAWREHRRPVHKAHRDFRGCGSLRRSPRNHSGQSCCGLLLPAHGLRIQLTVSWEEEVQPTRERKMMKYSELAAESREADLTVTCISRHHPHVNTVATSGHRCNWGEAPQSN